MARAVHRSGLVALGIATALMASCAFAAKDVVVAVGSNFTTLDPYDANDTLSQAVAKSFYQGLFGLDKEMKLKNVLAESYTVSDDGITYTVKLREGIKFQDGTDFNAAAVKANLDRASDPANHLKRYNLYKNIAKTEAIDPTTVKITLKQPLSTGKWRNGQISSATFLPVDGEWRDRASKRGTAGSYCRHIGYNWLSPWRLH